MGPLHVAKVEDEKIAKEIKIKDVDQLKELIGSKVKVNKLERLVNREKEQVMLAKSNNVLKEQEPDEILANQSKYCSGIGKNDAHDEVAKA